MTITMRDVAVLLVFSLQTLCLVSVARATTVDGFVTETSPQLLSLGHIRVHLTPQVQCRVVELTQASNLSLYKLNALGVPLYNHGSVRLAHCDALVFVIGSRVQLEGVLDPDSTHLVASRLTLYRLPVQSSLSGLALIEEEPATQTLPVGATPVIDIDGYPLHLRHLIVSGMAQDTTISQSVDRGTLDIRTIIHAGSQEIQSSPYAIKTNMWAEYHEYVERSRTNVQDMLKIWTNPPVLDQIAPLAVGLKTLRNEEAVIRPDSIDLHDGRKISLVADAALQDWVSSIGTKIIPPYQKMLPDSDPTKIHFRFFVVRRFKPFFHSDFLDINGVLPVIGGEGGGDEYHNPAPWSNLRDVIALPNGIILIPRHVIESLDNEAQLAAVMSYAVASVLQKQAARSRKHRNGLYFLAILMNLNEQALRVGIRQMYLAGYDIREAPFAWAVAQGKSVANPVVDSRHHGTEIPWFAEYAFNYVSQYYSDVDYSKLKRGEAEYQQFLGELRSADPEAFSDSTQAVKP